MKIKLPVTWQVCGIIEVDADNIPAAVEYFDQNSDHIALPEENEYVDGSFELSCREPEYIKLFQKKQK